VVRRLVELIRLHLGASVVVLVAVLIVGLGLNVWLRRAADDASSELGPTRDRARIARLELGVAQFELTAAQGDEASASAQRDEVRQRLTDLQQQLQAVQQQVAATSEVVALQGPQIEALGRCLNGVSAALNQAAVADTGANRTLEAAQLVCAEAQGVIRGTPQG
jgi:chromosome segregation ATPase